jgi:hypothetical protein
MALTYPLKVGRNHPLRHWPVLVFRVEDDSMRPALAPGDGLLALRGGRPHRGELRLFRDPRRSTRWLVKRVVDVYRADSGTIFEVCSDNTEATNAVGSDELGWISAAGSYRVIRRLRAKVNR